MEQEIWKDVVGYEGLYQVSNLGRIRKIEPKIICQGGSKYKSVQLKNKGKIKYCSVHRLVAQAFIPNPLNKETINHINGIKTDNRVCNLEWATYSENLHHAFDNNLRNKIKKWHKVQKIKEGKIIAIYRSIQKAANENKIAYQKLNHILHNENNEYNGFVWRIVNK